MKLKELLAKIICQRINSIEDSDRIEKIRHFYARISSSELVYCPATYQWFDQYVVAQPFDTSYGDIYPITMLTRALIRENEYRWFLSRESLAFCHSQNQFVYTATNSIVTIEGRTYRVGAPGIYLWSDGTWHLRRERLDIQPNSWPADPPSSDITGYHGSFRPWEESGGRPSGKKMVYGVELEIKARRNVDRNELARIAKSFDLLAERDGSLCPAKGVEIIGPPMSMEQYNDPDNPWNQFLKGIRGKAMGYSAGLRYGMHISINRLAMTRFHAAKLMVFIHRNRELCENVACRKGNDYQEYKRMGWAEASSDEGYKKLAIAIRSRRRLEVRMFRSTIDPHRFMQNLQFVQSAIDFTKDASAKDLSDANYKAWLSSRRKLYPNIAEFLLGKTKKKAMKNKAHKSHV